MLFCLVFVTRAEYIFVHCCLTPLSEFYAWGLFHLIFCWMANGGFRCQLWNFIRFLGYNSWSPERRILVHVIFYNIVLFWWPPYLKILNRYQTKNLGRSNFEQIVSDHEINVAVMFIRIAVLCKNMPIEGLFTKSKNFLQNYSFKTWGGTDMA